MRRRRRILCATALAPLALPLWGLTQPTFRVRRIGHLLLGKADAEVARIGRNTIGESLRRLGWEEGKNLSIERRYAEGDITRLDELARELVRSEVELIIASLTGDIGGALGRIAASRAEFLYVVNSGVVEPRLREITEFAIRNRIVSAGSFALFASVGGAMFYGANLQDIFDRSMSFVDRILRGAKPGDLPVELPSRFDLILNLATLRALGITVPKTVMLQATEVIE